MEPDLSLRHSQQPATCPYPEPGQPNPTSWWSIIIFSSHQCLSLPKALFPSGPPQQNPLWITPVHHTCHMTYFFHFSWFGKLNNIQQTVHTINLLKNRHLQLVLHVCPLPETTYTYHVHCATSSLLPLAMFTPSVDRAADGTEICRSLVYVICDGE